MTWKGVQSISDFKKLWWDS